jgi:hypothetical protein
MLLILSKRIRAGESNNQQIADDLEMLATESHRYAPENGEKELAEINDEWSRQYSHLIKAT